MRYIKKLEVVKGVILRSFSVLIVAAIVFFGLLTTPAMAGTTLAAGDIAFIGINSDGNDDFSFVLLKDISLGTTLNITDKGWIDATTSFNEYAGDTTMVWTATSNMSAGAIVHVQTTNNGVILPAAVPSEGSFTGDTTNTTVSSLGDQLFIFQGTEASPTFICGIHWNVESGVSTPLNWDYGNSAGLLNTVSDLPDQLTNGVNAIWVYSSGPVEKDNFRYKASSTTTGSPSDLRIAINTLSNWEVDDSNITPYVLNPFPCSFTVLSVNNAPVASNAQISGIAQVGQVLTGSYTYSDSESDPEGTSTFKWYRADDVSGTNKAAIAGQTSSTYTLTAADAGKYISFEVTPVASSGTSPGTAVESSRTGPVLLMSSVYVNSDTGNDTTGNGTSGNPYKTFTKGYAETDTGGTMILDGTFTWNDADETGDGTSNGFQINKSITITGQNDELAIIQPHSDKNSANKRIFIIGAGVTVDLQNLELRYGYGGNDNGGAIYINGNSSTIEIDNCYMHDNQILVNGGAVSIFCDATVTITNTTISNNQANGNGGGIQHNGTGILKVTNSTIYGNSSNNYGGGISIDNGTTYITNCTIVDNSSPNTAGGIAMNNGSVTTYIKNSIVANNDANSPYDFDFYDGTLNDNGYNIVESYGKTSGTGDLNGTGNIIGTQANLFGTGVSNTPSLNFSDNLCGVLPLSSGSIAIDAADKNSVNGLVAVPTTDQRGVARGINVDIGAYEYVVSNNAPTASNLQISGIAQVGQVLTASYTYSDSESDPEGTSTFEWYRADDASETNKAEISGQTSSTYTLTSADVGKYISFEVTPVASSGTSPGTAVESSYTGPIENVAPTTSVISPTSGTPAGGTSVTITGQYFTGATAVRFGSAGASSFTVNSDTQITATSPAGSGTVNVTVTTPGGTSAGVQFTYAAPLVNSISPNNGPEAGSTSVTITGANFTGATAVKFGSADAASFTVNSDTQITATSPAGSGTVNVTVTTPSGTSGSTQFTYNDITQPTISSGTLSAGNTYIDVTFSEGIYGANDGATALTAGKLARAFTPNGGTATNVTISSVKQNDNTAEGSASVLSGGETTVRVFLTITGTPSGVETIEIKPADGASIYDEAGNAMLTAQTTGAKTLNDEKTPEVTTVDVPANGTYISGQNLNFTVNFDENTTVNTTGGTPYIPITLSTGGTVNASYVSGSETRALVFRYTVQAGEFDNNGITLGDSIVLSNGTIKDSAGNNAVLTLNGVGSTADIMVGNTAPAFVGAAATLDANENGGAADIKSLLHVSDNDSGQTLTWSQHTAPAHGTLSFGSATASSGSADITPGGTITYTPAADYTGSDSFTVQVSDGTDTATRVITVTVHALPAVPVITGITDDTGVSGSDGITSDQTLSINGTAEASSTVEVFKDGASIGNTTANGVGAWSFDYTGTTLAEGTYSMTAKATNAYGGTGSASTAFSLGIDRTAPAAPSISGISDDLGTSAADGLTSDQTLSINGTAEANSTVEAFIGGVSIGTTTANGTGAWIFDYTGTTLTEGTYSLTSKATDAAGLTGSTSDAFAVIINLTAPAAPAITGITEDSFGVSGFDGITNDQTLSINGTVAANQTVEVFIGGVSIGTTTVNGSGNWTFDYTGTTLPEGTYLLTAKAISVYGVIGSASDAFTAVIDLTAPAKPVISGISEDTGVSSSDEITSDNTLTVSGTAEANSYVEVFNGDTFDSYGIDQADGSGNWSKDITFSTTSQSYNLIAVATDAAGNRDTVNNLSDPFAFTIDKQAPTPVVSSANSDPTSEMPVDITITFNEAVTGFDINDVTVTGGTKGNFSAVSGTTYTLDVTPTEAGEIAVDVSADVCQDTAGNNNAAAVSFTITFTPRAETAVAAAAYSQPAARGNNTITLTVKDSFGNTFADFDGDRTVTVTGYEQAVDSTYGSFNGSELEADGSTDITVSFTDGVASASLVLNKPDEQSIGFSIAGVAIPTANTLTITPIVAEDPSIGTQPQDATKEIDQTAAFTVEASVSDGGILSYQWQKSTDNGVSWANIDGATASAYTTGTLVLADSGNKYRCAVTNTRIPATTEVFSNVAALTVEKKEITGISFSNATATYNSTEKSITISGALPIGASVSYTNNTGTNAGTYNAEAVITGGDNYNNTTLNATLTINKAELTAAVGDYSKTYGENNPAFTVTVTGFLSGETAGTAAGYGAPTAGSTATVTTNAGTAGITISGGTATNYTFDISDTGTLAINPKGLDATATASDKTYDGTTVSAGTITLSGIVGTDNVSASGTFAFEDADAGTNKNVNVTGITLAGTKAGNYTLNNSTAADQADINPEAIAASAQANDKVYDGTTAASGTITLTGVLEADEDNVTADGIFAFADAAVGANKTVNVTDIYIAGAKAANYTLGNTTASTTASITKDVRSIAVTSLPTKTTYEFGQNLDPAGSVVEVTYNDDSTSETFLTLDMCTVADSPAIGQRTVTVEYLGKTTSFEVTYIKAPQAAPAAPELDVTAEGITVTSPVGSQYEYSRDDGSHWQSSVSFTGLSHGTQYTITARLKETATHNASDASTGTQATFNDITAPTLSAVSTVRTSHTGATIKFASSEAGQYYYQVTAAGASEPSINTGGAGTSCSAGQTAINPVITPGAKDMYIKVKDGANNVSTALKIEIPAYVMTDAEEAAADLEVITWNTIKGANTSPLSVTSDLTLSVTGSVYGSSITWTSTNPFAVGINGTVTRPVYADGDADVTVTASVYGGGNGYTKAFDITVLRQAALVNADLSALTISSGTLSPAFSSDTTIYSASVSSGTGSITVTPTAADVAASITVNENSLTDGSAIVSLSTGSNTIVIEVTAQDGTTQKTYTMNIQRASGGSGNDNTPPPADTQDSSETGVEVIVNGKSETSATATTTVVDNKTVTTVVVDDQKIEEKLKNEGNNTVVTIPVNTGADVIVGELNGQTIKSMEGKQAVLEVKTETATYALPAQQINIDAISQQMGENVELKDIKVQVEISKPNDDVVKIVENAAAEGEFTIVVPPMEFTVRCTYGDKTVSVSSFNAYVERTIAIPEGVDPSKITTGVVIEPDGTVRHVPTQIVMIDGKYYAKINSLSNSTYSVVWHPMEFSDVENHWAKDAINDMGSRMVISGIGNKTFEPDREITRAEFAAVVVRGLGLETGKGENPFTDVPASKWYSAYIQTAYEYGIISGYGDGEFGPEDKITREQAMAMAARAMKITGLKAEFQKGEAERLLLEFGDSMQSANWAKESMAACVKTGIVSGKSGRLLAPKDEITRAEVAVIIKRLLQKSNLI